MRQVTISTPQEIAMPSTRYQGSKRKILPWIGECLGRIEFDSALDAFGGTGAVSYLMKQMGRESHVQRFFEVELVSWHGAD